MRSFREHLEESAEPKVGEPAVPLKGYDSEQKSFEVADYPYGFTLRTKIRYWMEFKKNKGWRFLSQTLNPKTNKWNKPKASTYVEFGAFMYQDNKGYVGFKGLSSYSSLGEAKEFLKKYERFMEPVVIKFISHVIDVKEKRGLA
jgi:hypothetical protein